MRGVRACFTRDFTEGLGVGYGYVVTLDPFSTLGGHDEGLFA